MNDFYIWLAITLGLFLAWGFGTNRYIVWEYYDVGLHIGGLARFFTLLWLTSSAIVYGYIWIMPPAG